MLYTAKLGKKSENIGENRGKSENFGENRGISEESIPRSGRTEGRSCGRFRSFSVVFARNPLVIRSFFLSFPVIFRLIPIDSD